MWCGQAGLLLFASVIQSASEWPHHLPSYVRTAIDSLCSTHPLTSTSNHFSLTYHCTAYVPLLTDHAWLQVFWQVPNWEWANTNIDLPRASLQIAGMFSCWTWRVSVPALAWMLLSGSNVELPSALAGHGPHFRQQRAGQKPGAVMKQVGWQLRSWWKHLVSTGRCLGLGD